MKWLVAILTAVLQALLPWVVKRSRPTAEDAGPDLDTRDKLRAKVRDGAGCVRTIYVPHGTPVRLRQTVKDAKVWVKDSGSEPVAGRMDIPEGWYCLPVASEGE